MDIATQTKRLIADANGTARLIQKAVDVNAAQDLEPLRMLWCKQLNELRVRIYAEVGLAWNNDPNGRPIL